MIEDLKTIKKRDNLNQKRIPSKSFIYKKINPQIKTAIIAPISSFSLYPIKIMVATDSKIRAIGKI
jgi:hypothetical protein